MANPIDTMPQRLVPIFFCFMLSACSLAPTWLTGGGAPSAARPGGIEILERDLPAPKVFSKTIKLRWEETETDPGIWLAIAGAPKGEQVLVRNKRNRVKSIASMYQLQSAKDKNALLLSTDLAKALEIKSGQIVTLTITAIRREAVAVSTKSRHNIAVNNALPASED